MVDIIIRKARLHDLEAIKLLCDELTVSDLPYDKEIDVGWPQGENGQKYFLDKINGVKGVCFVAESEKNVIGYCTVEEMEVPSYRLVKVAVIDNLVVSEKYRSMGIGKRLINVFIEWGKSIGAQRAAVNVFSGNSKGMEFYAREGFTSFESILEKSLV